MLGLLILGFGVGFFIIMTKERISEIKTEEELEFQAEYIKELEETANYYKNGMDETLEQNIYLRKKLSKYES